MKRRLTQLELIGLIQRMAKEITLKEVAKRHRVSETYLAHVVHYRRDISAELADKLGYKRIVIFEEK